jgi:hypothetical protein
MNQRGIMNMTIRANVVAGLSAVCLLGGASVATAGGQLNQCWGQVASQLAKLGGEDDIAGGGMGSHSRSTQAANTVGGFANDNNAFGISFNTDGGRDGVGNVSKGAPHSTDPGDGGNGQHAINNSSTTTSSNVPGLGGSGFSNILDPVNGLIVGAGGENPDLHCDLVP